jgi:hypothetical protein
MKRLLLFLTLLLIYFAEPVFSQNDTIDSPLISVDTLNKDFGLFKSDEILNLSFRFDITQYRRKKPKDEYLNAVLTYHINEHDSISKDIKLKSRGIMRNEYCDFPPIRLNFGKNDFEKSDLAKIDKLKMVTHCRTGNEDYLLKEYLVYKLYNVLTDNSFRVRLVKVDYINTAKKSKPIETYAFLIEPEEILAARTNSTPVNSTKLSQKNIIPEIMDRMAIFNYMIGNTDWSVPNLHNCKIFSGLTLDNSGLGIIVPYDFDYSGLVNADYAIPYEGLGLKSVRERRYVGICRSEDVFINALTEFTEKKEEFYKAINNFTLLGAKTKKDMIEYLDTFYREFDKRNTIVYNLLGGCNKF